MCYTSDCGYEVEKYDQGETDEKRYAVGHSLNQVEGQ